MNVLKILEEWIIKETVRLKSVFFLHISKFSSYGLFFYFLNDKRSNKSQQFGGIELH